ncbi:MAG: ribosome biogenesis GTPase YlqF [Ruminococcaceae bacterium]|nr:ribosome biogenesis GTPase YlqF [Oscillospiraceae bacterium]
MTENTADININWFPGHMTKTKRQIEKILPIIDAVAEIVDARVPISSRNPDLPDMIKGKPLIILLNKCDMADPKETDKWIKYYKEQGVFAIPVDCKTGNGIGNFKNTVKTALADRLQQYKDKGMAGKPLRVMVVGIPNVGKSTFINKVAGSNRVKAENRPGVTRGNQWVTIDRQLELLDTPGVLWPKFEDPAVGLRLAFTGAIKDTVVDTELLAVRLAERLKADYPELLTNRYNLVNLDGDGYDTLCAIGKKRGMVIRGGETDTERASVMLLEEFRNCKIGRISLERVENNA